MEYLIGLILSVAVAGFATAIGLDRDRAFYPTVLIVIASYYVLFAVMGGSSRALLVEIVVASGFLLLAVVGFKRSLWFAVAAIVGHGVFDFVHHWFIRKPGCTCLVARFLCDVRCDFWGVVGGALAAADFFRLQIPTGIDPWNPTLFAKCAKRMGHPLVRRTLSVFVTFGVAKSGCKPRQPTMLVIFLMQKLRPRPLGNFPQFP